MSYKVTNIEYGIGPWGSEFIYGMVGNPKPNEIEQNVHSVTLLQGEGKNILVDTGVDTTDPAKKTLWDSLITRCYGVVWALEQVDLTPDDIDFVILTHAHIDHIGGVLQFRNAQICIQQKEFEAWERMVKQPEYAQAVLPAAMASDYPPVRELIDEGRVTLLNGDVINFLPGIDLHVVYDCHSVAEQLVLIKGNKSEKAVENRKVTVMNEQGEQVVATQSLLVQASGISNYVIGGDIAARPANLVGMGDWRAYLAPILGRSGSMLNVFEAYKWILEQINGDMTHLVLTHDSTMGERFESRETKDGLQIHYVC